MRSLCHQQQPYRYNPAVGGFAQLPSDRVVLSLHCAAMRTEPLVRPLATYMSADGLTVVEIWQHRHGSPKLTHRTCIRRRERRTDSMCWHLGYVRPHESWDEAVAYAKEQIGVAVHAG